MMTTNAQTSRLLRRVAALAIGTAAATFLASCSSPSSAPATTTVVQTAAQNLSTGILAQRAGNYGTATRYYQKVLAVQPQNADALFDLGDVQQFQQQSSSAEKNYRAAIAVDPNFVAAMYNLATLVSSSSPVEAEALYSKVVKLTPKDANALFNLGLLMVSHGQKVEGNAHIKAAEAIDPALKTRVPKAASSSTVTSTT